MTSQLRKIHKVSWLILAVVGVFFLIMVLQELNFSSRERSSIAQKNTNQFKKVIENDTLAISILESKLEIKLKQSLKSASSVVYGLNNDRLIVLGQIQNKGNYVFNVENSISSIIIKDKIKETTLTKIQL